MANYKAGDLSAYTAVIYLGSTYDEPLPTAFLDDVTATTKPVTWVYDNIWQLTARDADVRHEARLHQRPVRLRQRGRGGLQGHGAHPGHHRQGRDHEPVDHRPDQGHHRGHGGPAGRHHVPVGGQVGQLHLRRGDPVRVRHPRRPVPGLRRPALRRARRRRDPETAPRPGPHRGRRPGRRPGRAARDRRLPVRREGAVQRRRLPAVPRPQGRPQQRQGAGLHAAAEAAGRVRAEVHAVQGRHAAHARLHPPVRQRWRTRTTESAPTTSSSTWRTSTRTTASSTTARCRPTRPPGWRAGSSRPV